MKAEEVFDRVNESLKNTKGSDPKEPKMYSIINDESTRLANAHIEWFLSTLRPLLFSHFVYGFKHGSESAFKTTAQLSELRESCGQGKSFKKRR